MRAAVTQPVIDWLRRLPLISRSGDYLFCHAGLRPGIPIARQEPQDLLWIREEFLNSTKPFDGAMVVHGHNIAAEVDMRQHRIGIDTGAYRTGALTALFAEGRNREILSTVAGI